MGKEEVKNRFSGTQHYRSTGDFRNSRHRFREGNEHKDQALMEGRNFSGAAGRDSHIHETAISSWVKTELG